MATPTVVLINAGGLTDGIIDAAEAVTGWFDFDTLDTDLKIQGSSSITGTGRANNEDMYFDAGGAPVTAVGKVFRGWFNTVNIAYMGTLAGANPYEMLISDGTVTARKPLLGRDTYEGGWVYVFIDMDLVTTGDGWSGSPTLASIDRWGWTTGHDSNAKNVDNCWADVFRYMDGYYLTGGTSGDKVSLEDLHLYDMDNARAYGIVQRSRGVYFGTGTIQIGNGATTTFFACIGEVLQFIDTVGDMEISAGLYEISATGSGCDCLIDGSVIRGGPSGDASTRVYFDFSDTNHTLVFTANLIVNGGTVVFASGQDATNNTFDDCLQITHGGADMGGSVVKNYEGTAGTGAVLYNVNTDPDGEMDDMVFAKGTAATHAIQFGTNTPTTLTLRGIDFQGYNASDGNNDSTLYFPDTGSDVTWTVNLVGCTGNISYRKARAGDTVTLVIDPVTLTFEPLVANTEVRIYEAGTTTELDGVENSGTSFAYAYTYSLGEEVDIVIHHVGYIHVRVEGFELPAGDASFPVSQRVDPNYKNDP